MCPCYNRASFIRGLWAMTSQSGGGQSMIKVPACSVSGETFFLAHIQLLPGSEVSCIRTWILSMRTLPKHLPKVPLPHTSLWGWVLQCTYLGGHKHSYHSRMVGMSWAKVKMKCIRQLWLWNNQIKHWFHAFIRWPTEIVHPKPHIWGGMATQVFPFHAKMEVQGQGQLWKHIQIPACITHVCQYPNGQVKWHDWVKLYPAPRA